MGQRLKNIACSLGIGLLSTTAALANDPEFSGSLSLGYRYYQEDGQFLDQSESGFHPFASMRLDGRVPLGASEIALQFTGLLDDDNDRSFFNVQKAYYTHSFDGWDLVLGYNVEDWGVSSSRTVVNVLNARDQTNQLGKSDHIGTLMANANFFTEIGTFSAYLLGDHIQDNFGGPASRERGPAFTDDRLTRFEDANSLDIALRFSNSYTLGNGALDIGASIYDGTNREALTLAGCFPEDSTVSASACADFNRDVLANYLAGASVIDSALDANIGAVTALAPYYQEIREYGLTAVYATGNVQLRFEGFHRETIDESFNGAIIGGDYTFFNAMGGEGTLVVAAEYHYDDRSDRQPVNIYEDDLFLGLSYTHNDTRNTSFDLGMFYDLDESSKIYTISFSRSLNDRVRLTLRANHISATSDQDPLSAADQDSYLEFAVSTFF